MGMGMGWMRDGRCMAPVRQGKAWRLIGSRPWPVDFWSERSELIGLSSTSSVSHYRFLRDRWTEKSRRPSDSDSQAESGELDDVSIDRVQVVHVPGSEMAHVLMVTTLEQRQESVPLMRQGSGEPFISRWHSGCLTWRKDLSKEYYENIMWTSLWGMLPKSRLSTLGPGFWPFCGAGGSRRLTKPIASLWIVQELCKMFKFTLQIEISGYSLAFSSSVYKVREKPEEVAVWNLLTQRGSSGHGIEKTKAQQCEMQGKARAMTSEKVESNGAC
ncbi:hypothetical protein AXG93_1409s1120 [Marchantia polymorpha subsp. ruderalis]|uniref:Uncharacterized protein n=1 Tax=Marchantia polymorpha subsp. ruderalis TaxID=1480154 RepID=A0A176WKG6_MARPO|nr:hypothetical protein AXG93_1409s1120 [Marchantia polymorpha subsp. ruderalis]